MAIDVNMNAPMTQMLSDICVLVNERVAVADLEPCTYISTENMLPNKEGVTQAAALPQTIRARRYQKGDVLVSNIRPYFRKIWLADCCGGCSHDILVLRAREAYLPGFLYLVLSQDDFFSYATATAKGTKMPRGDKSAIMQYAVPVLPVAEQRKAVDTLVAINAFLAQKKNIDGQLERMVQAVYKSWFIDFEPWGGVMPHGWRQGVLSDMVSVSSGKRPPLSYEEPGREATVPLIGASSVMGYTCAPLYEGKILITGRVGTLGVVQRSSSPCWASDNTLVIKSAHYEYVYQILCRIDFAAMNCGSSQPLITQAVLKKSAVLIPQSSVLGEFEELAGSFMKAVEHNRRIRENVAALRETLWPCLMGEIKR